MMNTYFNTPNKFQLAETASEFMKGCVTGACLGGGALTVGAACGFTRLISAVANPLFEKKYRYIGINTDHKISSKITPIMDHTTKIVLASFLLERVGLIQTKNNKLESLGVVIAAWALSIFATFSLDSQKNAPRATNFAKGLITAELLGCNRILLPIIFASNPFEIKEERPYRTATYQSALAHINTGNIQSVFFALCDDVLTHSALVCGFSAVKFVGTKMHTAIYDYLEKHRPEGTVGMNNQDIIKVVTKSMLIKLVAAGIFYVVASSLKK